MPKITASKGYEPHEEGRPYHGTLKAIEEADGDYGEQFKWVFELDEDEGREQYAWCSRKLTPRSKLTRWVKALSGRMPNFDDDEEINLDDFVGRRVAVEFEHDFLNDGTVRDRVAKVRALPQTNSSSGDDSIPF